MIIQAEVIIARNLSLKSKFTDCLLERPDAVLCESDPINFFCRRLLG